MDRDHLPATPATDVDIPLLVRIGVTGHRALINEHLLRHSVDQVLSQLDALLDATHHGYTVVSPLAEGADRLVAQQVLARPAQAPDLAPDLEVILPLPMEEYLRDFTTAESLAEFTGLLERAHLVRTAAATARRRLERPTCGWRWRHGRDCRPGQARWPLDVLDPRRGWRDLRGEPAHNPGRDDRILVHL